MSQKNELTTEWREWVITNLQRNCSIESIVGAMVRDGFEQAFAEVVVKVEGGGLKMEGEWLSVESQELRVEAEHGRSAGPGRSPLTPNPSPPTGHGEKAEYVYEASRIAQGNEIVTADRTVRVLTRLEKPDVVVLGGLLSGDECEELIRLSIPKLSRSTTVDPVTGESKVIDRRTSAGTYFHLEETDFIARIDRRLAAVTNWPVDHSEGIQILNYQIGGEYRPHFDYFPPEEAGSASHTALGGQRLGSVVMYLNDVEDGGETIFPEIGLSVAPRRGNAVYFGYCNSRNQVDPCSLHGGAPVRRGEKWIATKWLRKEKRR